MNSSFFSQTGEAGGNSWRRMAAMASQAFLPRIRLSTAAWHVGQPSRCSPRSSTLVSAKPSSTTRRQTLGAGQVSRVIILRLLFLQPIDLLLDLFQDSTFDGIDV